VVIWTTGLKIAEMLLSISKSELASRLGSLVKLKSEVDPFA